MATRRGAVLGLDIGGTKLAVAVVTPDGLSHGFTVEPTRRDEGPDVTIARLFAMGDEAIRKSEAEGGPAEIDGVGIACGGPLDATNGILLRPLHLPGWVNVPIVDMATAHFGVPAVLENDATAAALAEHRYGVARGVETALYLTVSTGIGGGAIINGRLHRGAAGNGGEFGHIMVRPGGRECLCGRFGCLEVYASGTSIAKRATEALVQGTSSNLGKLSVVRAEDVAAAARGGDALAVAIWDETIDVMSIAITDLVNMFEPNIVVLGGGVTRSGSQLIDPIRDAVKRDAMPPAAAAVAIELAGLGDEVCVVGAAALAFDLVGEPAHA
jgi:glucokinase